MSNLVLVIQDVTFAMLKKKLIGEQPTVAQTNNFYMELDTTLAKDVDKMDRLSKASGQFLLPQDEMLFSNENYNQVYTEVKYHSLCLIVFSIYFVCFFSSLPSRRTLFPGTLKDLLSSSHVSFLFHSNLTRTRPLQSATSPKT